MPGSVRLLACLAVWLIALPVPARAVDARIHLELDSASVYLGDSLILDVESTGLAEPLDVSPLFRHADLLRETTGTRIAVVDGKVVEVRLRHMEFLPRRVGPIVFGPLLGESDAGAVRSNVVRGTVAAPIDTAWEPGSDDIQASITWSKRRVFVGEGVLLDLVLRHRYPTTDETILRPKFRGYDVLPVFEARRTIDQPGESGDPGEPTGSRESGAAESDAAIEPDAPGAWRRLAWRYRLWPRHANPPALDDLRWTGTLVRSRSRRGEFDIRVAAPPLDVQAAPTGIPGGWWLPAENVRLQSEWSEDPTTLRAGDQVIRTLVLESRGVLASHLPDVQPLETRGLRTTRLSSKRSQRLEGDEVLAEARFDYRVSVQSPVPVFLDTVRVNWWDTESDAAREAIVPARRINIGLPERADLLADLATGSHWRDRLWLTLESLPVADHVLGATLAVLTLTFAALLLDLPRRVRRRRRGVSGDDERWALPPL